MTNPVEWDNPENVTVGAGTTVYSLPVKSLAALQVTWHLSATSGSALASTTPQVSADGVNFLDAAAGTACEKAGASTEDLTIGQVVVLRTTDAASPLLPWLWSRLKVVGGGSDTIGFNATAYVAVDETGSVG